MYSHPSAVHGSRLLLLSEVCLGKIYPSTTVISTLKEPPDGYDSVQGVKTSDKQLTDFMVSIGVS